MTSIITDATLDAAAAALRSREYAGVAITPWRNLPKSKREKWLDRARVALQAAQDVNLGDGMANAALIAAAPDLYAALSAMKAATQLDEVVSAIFQADAAMAKARGEPEVQGRRP